MAAGGKDVFASRTADGGRQAMLCEVIPEKSHLLLVRCREIAVHAFMKTDEVDAAVQPFEQSQQFLGMTQRGIVLPADIFEADTALVRPVVLLDERHHIGDGHQFLRRHHLCPLVREGVVHRYGQMTFAFVQKALHSRYADGGDRDAFGRPGTAVRSGHDLQRPKDLVEVVHRFAFAHEDEVRQTVLRTDGHSKEYLIEDVCGTEMAVETERTGHAETATHLASCLRGHAERSAIVIGDIDRFYIGPLR